MITRPWRSSTLGAVAVAVLATGLLLPPSGVSQEGAKAGPEPAADLLTAAPFDRVTLNDGTVLEVDPVLPRPLPPYDPAKDPARKKKGKREVPPEGNIGMPGEPSKVKVEDEDDAGTAGVLTVHLQKGDVRDFTVRRNNIKTIEYFEDLLLAEGERLALARDYTRAFECYLKVRARDPAWRGLGGHADRLLFAEGSAALLEGNGERGLRLLGELFARKPEFPGLADKLAAAYGGRATRAFELALYAKGRRILHDAEKLAPGHATLRAARETFVNRAKELADGSSKKDAAGRVDALAEALRVWPTLEGAEAAYREAFAAEPTLEVAVLDVPRGVGPWVRSPADARVTRLLYLPILARDDDEAAAGKADGQLAAGLVATDLGRRLVVQVRPGVLWADGSRPVSAVDVTLALTDAAEPASPRYSARWADLLDRVETPDETHVEVRLTRATLKPGAWLLGPVGPAHGGSDGRVATLDRGRELVGDGPYRWAGGGTDHAELRVTEPTGPSPGAPSAGVRRVKEVRYANARQTLGALKRGEVSLVEHVPADQVAGLTADAGFRVGRYARPRLHRIALDGRTPALRNRNLRRGLSYAIDRRTLLEERVLGHPADETSLVSDGPFPKGSYADAPDVKPLGFDPVLAKMLVAAAHKELGGTPIRLTLEYPATPEAQAVVPKLLEAFGAFKDVGLEVAAVERPESELESGLRSGRRFDLAYRATRCDEPVTDAGPLIAPAYDAPADTGPLASLASPRILQLLLELERAPEWPTARGVVAQIDRECRDELPALPLWQTADHFARRTRLKGPKDVTDTLYERITTWEVEPWFARDAW